MRRCVCLRKKHFYDPIEDGTAEILRINADGSYNVISVNVFYSIGGVAPGYLELENGRKAWYLKT